MIDRTLDPGRLPSARIHEALKSSGRDWTSFGMDLAAALMTPDRTAAQGSFA
jgi:hypothetical protein